MQKAIATAAITLHKLAVRNKLLSEKYGDEDESDALLAIKQRALWYELQKEKWLAGSTQVHLWYQYSSLQVY